MRKRYSEAERAKLIDLVTSGRATAAAAAAQLEVPESTAYNWLRLAGRRPLALEPRGSTPRSPAHALEAPTFARLVRGAEARAAITLRIGGAVIEVHSGFDAALLREVVAVLVEAAS